MHMRSSMTSLQRVRAVLEGLPVDRVPNFDIFMTRAAHHVGASLSTYYLDYRVLCAANLAVLEQFHLDIVQAISDPYREAADTGLAVEFPDDGLPVSRTPLITEPSQLEEVRFPVSAFGPRMTDRLEAIRALRQAVADEVPVMGWVEGALAEAADLRGMSQVMMDLVTNPAWLKELLEKCAEVEIAFARAQVRAGAHIVGLGDAVASRSPRRCTGSSLCPTSAAFSTPSARRAAWPACTSAATPPTCSPTCPRAARTSSMWTGWWTWGERRMGSTAPSFAATSTR